jgi:hypothetical protein
VRILFVGEDPRQKTDVILFALKNNIEVVFPGGEIKLAEEPALEPITLLFEGIMQSKTRIIRNHYETEPYLCKTSAVFQPKRSKKIRSKHFK